MTEDETVGWHHRFNGHEFEQAQGDGEGQGSPVCCNPRGCKELDTTEQLNNNNNNNGIPPLSGGLRTMDSIIITTVPNKMGKHRKTQGSF